MMKIKMAGTITSGSNTDNLLLSLLLLLPKIHNIKYNIKLNLIFVKI